MHTLRLFLDVARCHSFSEAAALHGITQSAASQRIGQLEKRLNVTLIDRSVRPLVLTQAGDTFLAGVIDVLERYDRLERQVAADSADPQGRVRVAAIYSAGIELLNRLRQRFDESHPRIDIDIAYLKPDEVYRRVQGRECDIGILSYPHHWRRVGVVPLREEQMAVVCHPQHELARRRRVHATELSAHDMVTFDLDLPVGQSIRQYLKDQGARPTVSNMFDNIDTIKSALAVTDRFSLLPIRTVLRELDAGTLASATLVPRMTRPIGVIFRKLNRNGGAFMPATRVFVDYLLEHAGPSVDVVGSFQTERETVET